MTDVPRQVALPDLLEQAAVLAIVDHPFLSRSTWCADTIASTPVPMITGQCRLHEGETTSAPTSRRPDR